MQPARSLCSSKTDEAAKEWSVTVKRVVAPVQGKLLTSELRQKAVYLTGKRNRRGKSVQGGVV